MLLEHPEIRERARLLLESKQRPKSIRRAQKLAWTAVLRARSKVIQAGKVFDQQLAAATKLMQDTPAWERENRKMRESFIRLCERIRQQASAREMVIVKRIRERMADKLLGQVKRVPALRRAMSQRHSSLPTKAGGYVRESSLPPKRSGSRKTSAAASSIATPNSAPPTAQPVPPVG